MSRLLETLTKTMANIITVIVAFLMIPNEDNLREHLEYVIELSQHIRCLRGEKSFIKFQNVHYQLLFPISFYAGFRSLIVKECIHSEILQS
ncbi:hypothetical protein AVEN_202908-1 [Araneus ventricosus]|uniref:Uncharacterized protein n=1 Tax=Araneus ventricosus TaxID=182803 RepID=A0A4Y2QBG2_ARAVE|nr:hypothetical protein AVEN_202908-1 [Araneus ventricosus]